MEIPGYFGFTINPAQAESLADVVAAYGAGTIDGFGNPGKQGPVHFTHEIGEEGVTILTDGAIIVPEHLSAAKLVKRGAPIIYGAESDLVFSEGNKRRRWRDREQAAA